MCFVIIWLMLSLSLRPKVITLSGFHCICLKFGIDGNKTFNIFVVNSILTSVLISDRPKPKFEPKPKVPKFRLVLAEAETES